VGCDARRLRRRRLPPLPDGPAARAAREHDQRLGADAFFGHFLDIWATNPNAIPADVRAAYLKASREAIPSIVADYRASATVDVEHDQADLRAGNQLRVPVTVLQQDWGAALGFDAAARWRDERRNEKYPSE
jgi:hypothetical protein